MSEMGLRNQRSKVSYERLPGGRIMTPECFSAAKEALLAGESG